MARRRKYHKRKKPGIIAEHNLPVGFWAQIGAILLIAISVLFVIAWFNAGGPVLDWLHQFVLEGIGYAVYTVPVLFVYVAIEIFRAEDNHLSPIVKVATASAIIWFSALFGLLKNSEGMATGGVIGNFISEKMLLLVNSGIAAFIYILLILITLLFITRVSPFTIISNIWGLISHDSIEDEDEDNEKIMRTAAAIDDPRSGINGFKLNTSVPVVDHDHDHDDYSGRKLSKIPNVKYDKSPAEHAVLVTVSDPNWQSPSLDLLDTRQSPADPGDIKQNALIIQNTLKEFDIEVQMAGANVGPRVTQFTLKPPSGVKLARITQLETNIALNLAAESLRMEAPIPGEKLVGIEVPNKKAADVRIRSILTSDEWDQDAEPLAFAIGKDISGKAIVGELNRMPHLLIAGQTGSGKSVMINTLLTSLLYRNSPSELKLILVDPKRVEMTQYDDIPHLLTPVITEVEKTISALKWSVNEMERRYKLLSENRVKDIKSFNQKIRDNGKKIAVADEDGIMQDHENGAMPYIVIVVDELADFMMAAGRDMEALIAKLAQKARAVGIHLVLATQTPRADIITGLIKANISARIAFTVPSQLESRIILDQGGAEKLLGAGDMLFVTASMPKPKRIQGAWVTDEEIGKITAHLQGQSKPQYDAEVVSQTVHLNGKGGIVMGGGDLGDDDSLYAEAVQLVINSGKASASSLQRHLRIGYSRAARLIDNMENQGVVGPAHGARPREVLISSLDDLGGSVSLDDESGFDTDYNGDL